MGTTLVGALVTPDVAVIANVGDSRAYHISADGIKQITRDHSFVEMLVQSGQITREEALVHPQRNLITRAMGLTLRTSIDIFECTWKKGDLLLLCSDGLHGCVKDEALFEILISDLSLDEKCEAMVSLALSQGGLDNITVALAYNEEGCV